MNFLSLTGIELQKIRRSKILLILLAPVVIMWLPAIINSEKIQDVQGIPITPEHNFFIQGFMGMVWFMIPATLIICTVLLIQIEQTNHGMKKMLTLPINRRMLCLAKFAVLLLLPAVQMVMSTAAYYGSAFLSSKLQGYDYILPPGYIFPCIGKFYLAALPAAAVFWMIALLIQTPVFAVGTGLALCVPSVLIINTDTIMVSLIIASACRNMWISLGIGVILVFTFSVLPKDYLFLDLCPYCSPYQLLTAAEENGHAALFLGVCIGETALAGMAEHIYLKIRRYFS